MTPAVAQPLSRRSLDQLVTEMVEPGFATRGGRERDAPSRNGHVDRVLLVLEPPQSRYVRRWRRHARRCLWCRQVFRSLGMSLR